MECLQKWGGNGKTISSSKAPKSISSQLLSEIFSPAAHYSAVPSGNMWRHKTFPLEVDNLIRNIFLGNPPVG